MNSIYFVAQIITIFRKKEKLKNSKTWIVWLEIIQEVYREKYHKSDLKHVIYSAEAQYSNSKTLENSVSIFSEFSDQDKKEIIQLLYLYNQLLKNDKDVLFAKKLVQLLDQFISMINSIDRESIESTTQEWINNKLEDKFYYKIKLSATLKIILFDFILRWLSLWTLGNPDVAAYVDDSELGQFNIDLYTIYILSQFILIPFIVIGVAYVRDIKIEKKTNEIFNKLGQKKVKVIYKHSPWNYLISFIILIIGILISAIMFGIDPKDYKISLPIILCVFGSYTLILLSFFSKTYPVIPDIMSQFDKINIIQVKTNLNHHENDEEIIELEVNLKSANDKMEAYVLEAALFGALAFSGFLQIISSTNVSIATLGRFSQDLYQLFEGLVNFSAVEMLTPIQSILSKDGILSLMAFLTLFCAVFFLAVIASRLRFNDLSDSINKSLQLSKIYNEKEENIILNNQGSTNENSTILTKAIRKYLITGNLTLEQTIPIMEFMRFFRTLGIFTFFIIVVSGGLFVSVQLSLILAFIMFISFLFFKFKSIVHFFKNISNQFGAFYYRYYKKVFYFGVLLLAICLIIRSIKLDWLLADVLTYFSFSILSIHFIFSLFIPEKLNQDELNTSIYESHKKNIIVIKKILKISIALLLIGMLFKIMHIRFGSLILLSSIFLLSINILFSKKTYSNIYLTFIFRLSFSLTIILALYFLLTSIVILFLEFLTICSLGICILLILFYRKQILKSTITTTITLASIVFLMQFSFSRFVIFNFSFNQASYQNEMETEFIANKLMKDENGGFLYAKSNQEMDSLKFYMKKMDKVIERNGIRAYEIDQYCTIITENHDDTLILNHGLKWSNWVINKNHYYEHYLTNLSLLNKLEDCKGVLKLINRMEKAKIEIPEEDVKQDIIELKTNCLKELSKSK